MTNATVARFHVSAFIVLILVSAVFAQQSQPQAASATPAERCHVQNNTLVDDVARLSVTVDPKFHYLGSFSFDIHGIAGGYRYLWGETDRASHLRRTFIVQAEGYYPSNEGSYKYGTPNPVVLAGENYRHNVWIYDNDESAKSDPGNESDLTRKFMREHGIDWDSQLIMSRFARIVDHAGKNEIIFFYFENLADYTNKRVSDFPENDTSAPHLAILNSVDSASRRAFSVMSQH
jgi:hypothetical protein